MYVCLLTLALPFYLHFLEHICFFLSHLISRATPSSLCPRASASHLFNKSLIRNRKTYLTTNKSDDKGSDRMLFGPSLSAQGVKVGASGNISKGQAWHSHHESFVYLVSFPSDEGALTFSYVILDPHSFTTTCSQTPTRRPIHSSVIQSSSFESFIWEHVFDAIYGTHAELHLHKSPPADEVPFSFANANMSITSQTCSMDFKEEARSRLSEWKHNFGSSLRRTGENCGGAAYLSVCGNDDLSQVVVHGGHGLAHTVQGHVHLPLHSVTVGKQTHQLHHDLGDKREREKPARCFPRRPSRL